MEQTVEYIAEEETLQAGQTLIDYRMVTFTLAGKDYAIDILKVKEISKVSKFTFVPNSAPFVRGVYNLRGDIISVIDLRLFFNLPVTSVEEKKAENVVILRLDNLVLAVIVDKIDKVVGISRESIQPPHPIFGDVNIKYISGVVEDQNRLYVILDVERIFGNEERTETVHVARRPKPEVKSAPKTDNVDIGFIEETLATFVSFYASDINRKWIHGRFPGWKKQRGEEAVQLTGEQDAKDFLAPFWSPFSGGFWDADYIEKISSLLPSSHKGNFQVWNPGCGMGHEAYSVACMIKSTLPGVHLRILAQDNDLISIAGAPGLKMTQDPGEPYSPYLSGESGSFSFTQEITDALLFEYHDVIHDNTLPKLDLVVMRDVLSLLTPESSSHIFSVLEEEMKPGALLLLGANEEPLKPEIWETVENAGVVAYKKKS